jgi:hypothetical protein
MTCMDERQRYALTHPISDPDDPRELARVNRHLQRVRRQTRPLLILSTLAVDR